MTSYWNWSKRWAYVLYEAKQLNGTNKLHHLQSNISRDGVFLTGTLQSAEWRQEGWVIQQTCLVLSLCSLNLYDVAKRKTMGLLLSTGVSQRRWLVKTGRFPLRRELTHIKGFCCCNNSQLGLGCLPRDSEIIAVFNLHKYPHWSEYKKAPVAVKASDSVCGNVIHCWPGDKHQDYNLRLTKRQTVSHLKGIF